MSKTRVAEAKDVSAASYHMEPPQCPRTGRRFDNKIKILYGCDVNLSEVPAHLCQQRSI